MEKIGQDEESYFKGILTLPELSDDEESEDISEDGLNVGDEEPIEQPLKALDNMDITNFNRKKQKEFAKKLKNGSKDGFEDIEGT